jgi:hypothetical protein
MKEEKGRKEEGELALRVIVTTCVKGKLISINPEFGKETDSLFISGSQRVRVGNSFYEKEDEIAYHSQQLGPVIHRVYGLSE